MEDVLVVIFPYYIVNILDVSFREVKMVIIKYNISSKSIIIYVINIGPLMVVSLFSYSSVTFAIFSVIAFQVILGIGLAEFSNASPHIFISFVTLRR